MTPEQKQLLLKDLCARLPYKTYIEIVDEDGNVYDEVELEPQHINTVRYDESISIRPYLHPMSSMTEKEKKTFDKFICIDEDAWLGKENGCVNQAKIMSDGIDWLLANQFDYRGLIPMGLALESREGMYD